MQNTHYAANDSKLVKHGDLDEPQVMETDHLKKEVELQNYNLAQQIQHDSDKIIQVLNPHTSLSQLKSQTEKKKANLRLKEIIFMTIMQTAMIVLFATCTTYGTDVSGGDDSAKQTVALYYPMFQDVHVMIFVGFGFLMTFLKYHGWSSVMFNMLVSCWCIQWGILNISFFHALFEGHWSKVQLDITYLVEGDFAAGAVLISFGAVLGKVNSFQLLVMATIEVVLYSCNVGLGQKQFHAVDMGGSMFVHTFGAYFGVACALALGPKKIAEKNTKIGSDYTSNLFAAIGCIFLFMFWPSFNGVLATGNGQHRVVVNTVLAISASTLGAFYISNIINKGLFGMEDCLNASLAGGVIIGSSSDLVASAWLSILIGFLGGVISCLAYNKLGPCLERCLGLHDTCGVHNLHGIPGVLGGIIGAFSSGLANTEVYGDQLSSIFTELANGRTQKQQAGYQLACLGSTLAISLIGGYLTGKIIGCPFFEGAAAEDMFDDEMWWHMHPEEQPIDKRLDQLKA